MKRILIALILAVSNGSAEGPAVRGPVLGYFFDPGAAALRPILGIPGAATLGQPLDLGELIQKAVVSPNGELALAVAASDFRVLAVRLPSGAVEACQCPRGPDRIVFSPDGNLAALYYASESSITVLRGAKSEGAFDLSLMPGKPTALAVSDSGAVLAAFTSSESSGTVHFFEPGGEPRLTLSLSRASALAFLPGSTDALVADDMENRLYLLRDPGGRAEAALVASASDGINGPVAVLAAGGQRALTANARSVTITDLLAGTSSVVECGCAPDDLQPLKDSVYRITRPAPGPIWLLDSQPAGSSAAFVPPDSPAQAKAGLP